MLIFVDKRPRMTSDEAANKYPNSAIMMVNTEPHFTDTPYGKAMSGVIGELLAVADNNEADLKRFKRMMEKFNKPESNTLIIYNFPYNESLEEYMENYKDT